MVVVWISDIIHDDPEPGRASRQIPLRQGKRCRSGHETLFVRRALVSAKEFLESEFLRRRRLLVCRAIGWTEYLTEVLVRRMSVAG